MAYRCNRLQVYVDMTMWNLTYYIPNEYMRQEYIRLEKLRDSHKSAMNLKAENERR